MLSGTASDWMIARHVRIVTVRKIMTSLGTMRLFAVGPRDAGVTCVLVLVVCAALFGPALSLVLLSSKCLVSWQRRLCFASATVAVFAGSGRNADWRNVLPVVGALLFAHDRLRYPHAVMTATLGCNAVTWLRSGRLLVEYG